MSDAPIPVPKRSAYKTAEVCEIAHIQPYVLRSWESEFPRMGLVRGGARIYRPADLEQVLRIKQLVFEEGLTLAGARRRIEEERQPQAELPLEEFVTPEMRQRIASVKQGLRELLGLLGGPMAGALPLVGGPAASAGDGRPRGSAATAAHAATKAAHKKAAPSRDKSKTARRGRRHVGRA